MVEVRVLGPVELVAEDGPVPLGAPKQRRLLSALVVHAGEARSADLLIDAIWGPSPPTSAAKLLQTYVSQLRKALPAPARIRTRGAGYALELEDESLDAARFERLLSQGRAASREGNPALAASLLRRALGLWRGQAYGDFAYEEFAREEAERLEELRLAALEERIEAELALGRHDDVLPELRSLAAAHPGRERLQAQAMLALYRCGRQSEALDLYTDARARLRATAAGGSRRLSISTRMPAHACATSLASSRAPGCASCRGGSSSRTLSLRSRPVRKPRRARCQRRRTGCSAAAASSQSCVSFCSATRCGCSC